MTSLDELDALLLDKCVAYAKVHRHPEEGEKTIRDVFEGEPSRRHRFEPDGERGQPSCPAWGRSTASMSHPRVGREDLHRAVRQQ